MRRLLMLTTSLLLTCGALAPLKNPFATITPGGACTSDDDCAIGSCPNACNLGQPFCTFPRVYLKTEIEKACPCVKTPSVASCAPPSGEACGPQPGCAVRGIELLRAKCVASMCVGQLPDGGTPPP